MIRLTITLVLCLGVAMILFGEDIERAEGSDQPNDRVAVTRLEQTPLSGPVPEPGALQDAALAIPLHDTEKAMAAALRATEQGTAPVSTAGTRAPVNATVPPEASPPAVTDYWYVTGNRVNLRRGPSTSSAVIGQMSRGEIAEMVEETPDGWYRIAVPGTLTEGYIFGKFLSPDEPL